MPSARIELAILSFADRINSDELLEVLVIRFTTKPRGRVMIG